MTKLAAVALILALPALVTADINRLRPRMDAERPDAVCVNARRPEPQLAVMSPLLPVWDEACVSAAAGPGRTEMQCPASVPEHLTRRQSQPDCRNHVNAPVLWPHAPRTDEQRTVTNELRSEQARLQDRHPTN